MGIIKEKVKGAFDLTFYFGRGIKPFEADNTKAAALKSIWIPVALYPLAILASWLHPPRGMEELGKVDLAVVTSVEYIGGFILGNLACWLFAYALRVEKNFWLFFQASNWTGIASTVLSVPFLVLAMTSSLDALHMSRVLTVVSIYFAMVTSCVAFKALKINWELSVFLATLSMMMSQLMENLMFTLYHIPIDWIG
jgi:hypothetical protein